MVTWQKWTHNLLIRKYSLYKHSALWTLSIPTQKKKIDTLRSFQFSLRPSFKKKARWPNIPRHTETFCKPPTLTIIHQGFQQLLTWDTYFHFPTTKTTQLFYSPYSYFSGYCNTIWYSHYICKPPRIPMKFGLPENSHYSSELLLLLLLLHTTLPARQFYFSWWHFV